MYVHSSTFTTQELLQHSIAFDTEDFYSTSFQLHITREELHAFQRESLGPH